jgi:hypothetical protein
MKRPGELEVAVEQPYGGGNFSREREKERERERERGNHQAQSGLPLTYI